MMSWNSRVEISGLARTWALAASYSRLRSSLNSFCFHSSGAYCSAKTEATW